MKGKTTMKNAKKIVALLLCAVLLMAASAAGTLAYLTAQVTVTNTFTVGSVSFDSENALDESHVNEYGEQLYVSMVEGAAPVVKDDVNATETLAPRVNENEYKLIPGHTYTKDPQIHIEAGSEDCYLFVKVDNGIADIEDDTNTIAAQLAANGWEQLKVDGTDVPNVYCKVDPVETEADKNNDIRIFESFKIATDADVSTYGNAKIVITAYAVQADGFDSAEAAWKGANFS